MLRPRVAVGGQQGVGERGACGETHVVQRVSPLPPCVLGEHTHRPAHLGVWSSNASASSFRFAHSRARTQTGFLLLMNESTPHTQSQPFPPTPRSPGTFSPSLGTPTGRDPLPQTAWWHGAAPRSSFLLLVLSESGVSWHSNPHQPPPSRARCCPVPPGCGLGGSSSGTARPRQCVWWVPRPPPLNSSSSSSSSRRE